MRAPVLSSDRHEGGQGTQSTRYVRSGNGLEFDRLCFFSDAVFVVALTLLVVKLGLPARLHGSNNDPSALLDALGKKAPLLGAFFVGCFVIGSFWVRHHRFTARLRAIDGGFIRLTVAYLALVALLPFPTGILGEFPENPISLVAFAAAVGAVSAMEAVLLRHASRQRLFRRELPREVYRWMRTAALVPVGLLLLSVPLAFVSTWLAIGVWFATLALQVCSSRGKPPGTDE
jgi:uncharacterized membrane protein